MGPFHRLVSTLFFGLLLFSPFPILAEDFKNDPYLQSLIKLAIEKKSYEKRFWVLLLHYKKNLFGNYKSEEDGPSFFVSPNGKIDPKGELLETLKAFFIPMEDLDPEEEHPQCVFPARYKWLKSELSIDPSRLNEQRCHRLEGWLEKLNPEKVTLVFASYFLNNPASMFGHTLLRIDTKREGTQHTLLNYGVNYAANVDTENAFLYIFKGLFGMFKGTFTVFPFYIKVQEYGNIESRDLWEYELKFNEDQINYLLLHLWELGGNYFDYFYFQENCSYHILSLLEVANPNLELTDHFLFSVIPGDTIKVVTEQPGLVSNIVYRPSILNQMNEKILQMTNIQKKLFYDLAKDPSGIYRKSYHSLSIPEKSLVLDAYLDYDQYLNMRKEAGNTKEIKNREILLERSRLGSQENVERGKVYFSTSPEKGHESSGLRLGFGAFEKKTFEEFSFYPAYHDFLAKDTGYIKDSQILFFDLAVRYYNNLEKFKVEKFKMVDIISLTPYDPLFRKLSWKLNFGIDTIKDFDCQFCNSFKGAYSLGMTYKKNFFSPFLLFLMVDMEIEFSDQFRDYFRGGGGMTFGGGWEISQNWRTQFMGQYLNFPIGHPSDYYKTSISLRYAISQNQDFRVSFDKIKDNEGWKVSFSNYF